MCAASRLASAHEIDWEAVEAFAVQEIVQCLQSDKLFMSAQHTSDQSYHAEYYMLSISPLCLIL
jgi:hypothetical protein